MMFRPFFRSVISGSFTVFLATLNPFAQTGEQSQICEVKPVMKCLDKAVFQDSTLFVPIDAVAIQREGFLVCDSSFNYTTSPDIVLVMDNTASMDSIQVVDGRPRWCDAPDKEADFGCISGDPSRLRGAALRTFLDSALVKGGKGINVGVVTFARSADAKSERLLPLTVGSIDSIKASIVMESLPNTNYTDAFNKARALLTTSKKPKSEQFIIFVSDGRPNFPDSDVGPYAYKAFWDSLPVTHSIFLGDNINNYKDMQDVAQHTGGSFLPIKDVNALAKYLTDDLAKTLFRRASPTLTTVQNLSDSVVFQVKLADHIPNVDTSAYTLRMPGPLELVKGDNNIVIRTEYGYGGSSQDIRFKIRRSATGPYMAGLEEKCRDRPNLVVYNASRQAINYLGLPFTIGDSTVSYSLTTGADLDSFKVEIRTQSSASAQSDFEIVKNSATNRIDSTWSGQKPFQHLTQLKSKGDDRVQVEHGEFVMVTYRHPFIREDSATAKVRMKYGPEFDHAEYRDLNGDGRIETVTIRFLEALSALPSSLQFKIRDARGEAAERTAATSASEINFGVDTAGSEDRARLVVTFSNPFPFGMTSVANPDSSGRTFRQVNIPIADAFFRVDDSVPPVIIKAEVTSDKVDEHSLVRVTYSEPITLAEPALEPLVFKRDTLVFLAKDLPLARIEKVKEGEYIFHLEPTAPSRPVGGDFIAINNNGDTKDLQNLVPTKLVFTSVGGAAPSQTISDFFVTFANGSRSNAVAGIPAKDREIFIPVDSKGSAMPGTADGKCGSCTPQENNLFSGSVINIVTKQPLKYTLNIYSNLGQFVSRGSGKITEADLALLEKNDKNEYTQRIVWTGIAQDGQAAGTGAYVLKAVFQFDRNLKTGAKPSTTTQVKRFGFLRSCCDTNNSGWFE